MRDEDNGEDGFVRESDFNREFDFDEWEPLEEEHSEYHNYCVSVLKYRGERNSLTQWSSIQEYNHIVNNEIKKLFDIYK